MEFMESFDGNYFNCAITHQIKDDQQLKVDLFVLHTIGKGPCDDQMAGMLLKAANWKLKQALQNYFIIQEKLKQNHIEILQCNVMKLFKVKLKPTIASMLLEFGNWDTTNAASFYYWYAERIKMELKRFEDGRDVDAETLKELERYIKKDQEEGRKRKKNKKNKKKKRKKYNKKKRKNINISQPSKGNNNGNITAILPAELGIYQIYISKKEMAELKFKWIPLEPSNTPLSPTPIQPSIGPHINSIPKTNNNNNKINNNININKTNPPSNTFNPPSNAMNPPSIIPTPSSKPMPNNDVKLHIQNPPPIVPNPASKPTPNNGVALQTPNTPSAAPYMYLKMPSFNYTYLQRMPWQDELYQSGILCLDDDETLDMPYQPPTPDDILLNALNPPSTATLKPILDYDGKPITLQPPSNTPDPPLDTRDPPSNTPSPPSIPSQQLNKINLQLRPPSIALELPLNKLNPSRPPLNNVDSPLQPPPNALEPPINKLNPSSTSLIPTSKNDATNDPPNASPIAPKPTPDYVKSLPAPYPPSKPPERSKKLDKDSIDPRDRDKYIKDTMGKYVPGGGNMGPRDRDKNDMDKYSVAGGVLDPRDSDKNRGTYKNVLDTNCGLDTRDRDKNVMDKNKMDTVNKYDSIGGVHKNRGKYGLGDADIDPRDRDKNKSDTMDKYGSSGGSMEARDMDKNKYGYDGLDPRERDKHNMDTIGALDPRDRDTNRGTYGLGDAGLDPRDRDKNILSKYGTNGGRMDPRDRDKRIIRGADGDAADDPRDRDKCGVGCLLLENAFGIAFLYTAINLYLSAVGYSIYYVIAALATSTLNMLYKLNTDDVGCGSLDKLIGGTTFYSGIILLLTAVGYLTIYVTAALTTKTLNLLYKIKTDVDVGIIYIFSMQISLGQVVKIVGLDQNKLM